MLARCRELVAARIGTLFVFRSWDVHDGRVVGGSGGFMVIDLNDYRLLTIFLVSAVAVLAATEIGRFLGVRAKSREGRSIATFERNSRAPGVDDRFYFRRGLVPL